MKLGFGTHRFGYENATCCLATWTYNDVQGPQQRYEDMLVTQNTW